MEITEVRIKLVNRRSDKLRAFCSITLDNSFVIRDLKIIEGSRGPFVAMPSRKVAVRCPKCALKNHRRAKFCNECGSALPPEPPSGEFEGRPRLHADIAHPISTQAREALEKRVLSAYASEVERSQQPGYKPVEIYEGPDGDPE
jgi:stage V sporulation protein G